MTLAAPAPHDVESRARKTRGTSGDAIYGMVLRALERRGIRGGTIADVGCGTGTLFATLRGRFDRYVGIDVVRYDGFPEDAEFAQVDLDTSRGPFPDGSFGAVAAVEVIEHLENPRAFVRELSRLAEPDGWVVVTTPNQLSLLSLLTLLVKKRFVAFQDADYPNHLTALLEVDLQRIALECGLVEPQFEYSLRGRVVFTGRHYPRWLSRLFPRALSDNVLLIARKARDE